MKLLKVLKHIGISLGGVILLLGIPFFTSDYFAGLISGVDVTGGASVILDAPSGNFTVLINPALHTDDSNLEEWKKFFMADEDFSFVFEDISCAVAKSDSAGGEMAESYLTRLPENQMTVKKEDSVLLLSRLENKLYDVVVMSSEYMDQTDAESSIPEDAIRISVKEAEQ